MDALTLGDTSPVRAAGGVVWRPGGGRGPARDAEVVLVHRPRYDDWTLPKGKLRRREHPIPGACREVFEETAILPSVGARLPRVSYPTRGGPALTEKIVDYWSMTVAADLGFTPGPETDGLSWLPVNQALARLSYPHDVKVLSAFAHLPPMSAPVVLLRHASAGERGSWPGPDTERPLDRAGVQRADELAVILRCFHPARLRSGTPRRCAQTLEPFAAEADPPVGVDVTFDESADPQLAAVRIRRLAREPGSTVICSQGRLIPRVLSALTGAPAASYRTPKGTGWVLSFADEELATIDELA